MDSESSFAKKYGIFVVLFVVFVVIAINLFQAMNNNAQEAIRMSYSQTSGAAAERQFELEKKQKEIDKLRAQAELERAKRTANQLVVIPPNGAVFNQQPN